MGVTYESTKMRDENRIRDNEMGFMRQTLDYTKRDHKNKIKHLEGT